MTSKALGKAFTETFPYWFLGVQRTALLVFSFALPVAREPAMTIRNKPPMMPAMAV